MHVHVHVYTDHALEFLQSHAFQLVLGDATKSSATLVANTRSSSYSSVSGALSGFAFTRDPAVLTSLLHGSVLTPAKLLAIFTFLTQNGVPNNQEATYQEFLAGPAKTGGAVIAVGDFNSRADGSSTTTYADLTKSYFDDAWDDPSDPGYTCCQNDTLTNPVSGLSSAIDFVFTHAPVRALSADVIGDIPFQAVPPFWPSDHAGVVATVRIH